MGTFQGSDLDFSSGSGLGTYYLVFGCLFAVSLVPSIYVLRRAKWKLMLLGTVAADMLGCYDNVFTAEKRDRWIPWVLGLITFVIYLPFLLIIAWIITVSLTHSVAAGFGVGCPFLVFSAGLVGFMHWRSVGYRRNHLTIYFMCAAIVSVLTYVIAIASQLSFSYFGYSSVLIGINSFFVVCSKFTLMFSYMKPFRLYDGVNQTPPENASDKIRRSLSLDINQKVKPLHLAVNPRLSRSLDTFTFPQFAPSSSPKHEEMSSIQPEVVHPSNSEEATEIVLTERKENENKEVEVKDNLELPSSLLPSVDQYPSSPTAALSLSRQTRVPISLLSRTGSHDNDTLESAVTGKIPIGDRTNKELTPQEMRSLYLKCTLALYLISLLPLVWYTVAIYLGADRDLHWSGFINASAIFVVDGILFMLLIGSRCVNTTRVVVASIVLRLCIGGVGAMHWFTAHSIMYVVIGCFLAHSILQQRLEAAWNNSFNSSEEDDHEVRDVVSQPDLSRRRTPGSDSNQTDGSEGKEDDNITAEIYIGRQWSTSPFSDLFDPSQLMSRTQIQSTITTVDQRRELNLSMKRYSQAGNSRLRSVLSFLDDHHILVGFSVVSFLFIIETFVLYFVNDTAWFDAFGSSRRRPIYVCGILALFVVYCFVCTGELYRCLRNTSYQLTPSILVRLFLFFVSTGVVWGALLLWYTIDSSFVFVCAVFSPPLIVNAMILGLRWHAKDFQLTLPLNQASAVSGATVNGRETKRVSQIWAALTFKYPSHNYLMIFGSILEVCMIWAFGYCLHSVGDLSQPLSLSFSFTVSLILFATALVVEWYEMRALTSHFISLSILSTITLACWASVMLLADFGSDSSALSWRGVTISLILVPWAILFILAIVDTWDNDWKPSQFARVIFVVTYTVMLTGAVLLTVFVEAVDTSRGGYLIVFILFIGFNEGMRAQSTRKTQSAGSHSFFPLSHLFRDKNGLLQTLGIGLLFVAWTAVNIVFSNRTDMTVLTFSFFLLLFSFMYVQIRNHLIVKRQGTRFFYSPYLLPVFRYHQEPGKSDPLTVDNSPVYSALVIVTLCMMWSMLCVPFLQKPVIGLFGVTYSLILGCTFVLDRMAVSLKRIHLTVGEVIEGSSIYSRILKHAQLTAKESQLRVLKSSKLPSTRVSILEKHRSQRGKGRRKGKRDLLGLHSSLQLLKQMQKHDSIQKDRGFGFEGGNEYLTRASGATSLDASPLGSPAQLTPSPNASPNPVHSRPASRTHSRSSRRPHGGLTRLKSIVRKQIGGSSIGEHPSGRRRASDDMDSLMPRIEVSISRTSSLKSGTTSAYSDGTSTKGRATNRTFMGTQSFLYGVGNPFSGGTPGTASKRGSVVGGTSDLFALKHLSEKEADRHIIRLGGLQFPNGTFIPYKSVRSDRALLLRRLLRSEDALLMEKEAVSQAVKDRGHRPSSPNTNTSKSRHVSIISAPPDTSESNVISTAGISLMSIHLLDPTILHRITRGNGYISRSCAWQLVCLMERQIDALFRSQLRYITQTRAELTMSIENEVDAKEKEIQRMLVVNEHKWISTKRIKRMRKHTPQRLLWERELVLFRKEREIERQKREEVRQEAEEAEIRRRELAFVDSRPMSVRSMMDTSSSILSYEDGTNGEEVKEHSDISHRSSHAASSAASSTTTATTTATTAVQKEKEGPPGEGEDILSPVKEEERVSMDSTHVDMNHGDLDTSSTRPPPRSPSQDVEQESDVAGAEKVGFVSSTSLISLANSESISRRGAFVPSNAPPLHRRVTADEIEEGIDRLRQKLEQELSNISHGASREDLRGSYVGSLRRSGGLLREAEEYIAGQHRRKSDISEVDSKEEKRDERESERTSQGEIRLRVRDESQSDGENRQRESDKNRSVKTEGEKESEKERENEGISDPPFLSRKHSVDEEAKDFLDSCVENVVCSAAYLVLREKKHHQENGSVGFSSRESHKKWHAKMCEQPQYMCLSCDITSLCQVCAIECHSCFDHEVVFHDTVSFVCRCGGDCRATRTKAEREEERVWRQIRREGGVEDPAPSIIDSCLKEGRVFEDTVFRANTSSLFVDPNQTQRTSDQRKWLLGSWHRSSEFMGSDSVLFELPTDPLHIKQGLIGDCWLLSAMSVLTLRFPYLARVFLTKEVNKAGVYSLRLFKNGKPHVVVVDDNFLTYKGRPAFASSENKRELWVMLLEKAYAKMHGSYEAIECGFVDQALVDLTGGISSRIDLTKKETQQMINNGSLWNLLLSFHCAGHLMGAGTPASRGSQHQVTKYGIVLGKCVVWCEWFVFPPHFLQWFFPFFLFS